MRLPTLVLGAEADAAARPPSARPLAGILEQEVALRHPQPAAGA